MSQCVLDSMSVAMIIFTLPSNFLVKDTVRCFMLDVLTIVIADWATVLIKKCYTPRI